MQHKFPPFFLPSTISDIFAKRSLFPLSQGRPRYSSFSPPAPLPALDSAAAAAICNSAAGGSRDFFFRPENGGKKKGGTRKRNGKKRIERGRKGDWRRRGAIAGRGLFPFVVLGGIEEEEEKGVGKKKVSSPFVGNLIGRDALAGFLEGREAMSFCGGEGR